MINIAPASIRTCCNYFGFHPEYSRINISGLTTFYPDYPDSDVVHLWLMLDLLIDKNKMGHDTSCPISF